MPYARIAASLAVIFPLLTTPAAAAPKDAKGEMPAATRLSLPGEKHKWLEPLVGEWDVEMLVYTGPGADPIVSKDVSAKRFWTLDGRYLREELCGIVFGNKSARDGVLGYNALDGRFEWVTVDTFEPGQMIYLGRGDETKSGFSMYGESTEAGFTPEPTGRKRELRFEFDIQGPDKNVQRIFAKFPGQPEFLFVEQRFTRKK